MIPAVLQNRTIETGLLPHIAARLGNRSARASSHVRGLQVFDADGAEAGDELGGLGVVPMPASAGRMRLGGACAAFGFAVPFRPATSLRGLPLRLPVAPVKNPKSRNGHGVKTPGRQRNGVGNAAIDPDRRAGIRRNLVLDLASERDVPAERIARHGGVLEFAGHRPRIAETHPADLGQAHGGPAAIETLGFDLAALEAEAFVDALTAWRRVIGNAVEEVLEGSVKIAKRLLLACLRDGGNPVKLGAERGQLFGLGNIAKVISGVSAVLSPEMLALEQGCVIDRAAHARELPKQRLLFWCRIELVFEAARDHIAPYIQSEGDMQEFRTGRHCVFALHVHLVFITKYRRGVLSELAIRDLTAIFARICTDFEATLVECSGEDDHVHLLVEYPPKLTLSKLVNSLKGVSSRLLRQDRPEIAGRYFKGVLWSPSYFAASCGGAPISIIRQYIEQQRSALPPRPERRGFRTLRG